MPTISLTLPVSGNVVTAGLHATNYSALQTLLNGGLDTANWGSGKIFAPSKLQQESAVDGDGLVWDNASSTWKRTTDKALRVGALAAGSNGQVLTTTGGVAAWGSVGGAYDRVTSAVDVQNTVTETSLYTKSIIGGDMSTNKMLRLTALGDYLHNNVAGDTVTIKVKFGGTTFWGNATSLTAAIGAARHPWVLFLNVANLGAANSQMIAGVLQTERASDTAPSVAGIGQAGGVLAGNPMFSTLGISTLGTIDTSSAQTLDVTAQWSAASANNSWRMRYALLELV